MKRRPIIYIAGPYRDPHGREFMVHYNIQRARFLAELVWQSGGIALCPHLNSAHMGGVAPDEVFLEGDLELLRRCADAVLLTEDWEASQGACGEKRLAEELGREVLEDVGVEWETAKLIEAFVSRWQEAHVDE